MIISESDRREKIEQITRVINMCEVKVQTRENNNRIVRERIEVVNYLNNLFANIFNRLNSVEASKNLLGEFYSKSIIEKTKTLSQELTDVINCWYGNNYNIDLEIKVTKTGKYLSTKDTIRNGSLKNVTGSACQQTIAFLISTRLLRGKFFLLDEVFNNFGETEVKNVPEILDSINDVQFVIIEHKYDIINPDAEDSLELHVTRDEFNGSVIEINDKFGNYQKVLDEINDKTVTQEDIDLLIKYGKYQQ